MQIEITSHLKTAVGATPPWVRIPPLPPNSNSYERTKETVRGAKSEQKTPSSIYSIYNSIYRNRPSVLSLFMGGAA